MLKINLTCNKYDVNNAFKIIQNGGIVIFPTDTVYGIGCDPYNSIAVKNIYDIKRRSIHKPLPILAYSKKEISKIAVIDKLAEKIIKKFFPGKLTLILKLKSVKIKKSLNLNNKIAVRIPDNYCVLSLLKKCKLLVGTSANISDHNSFVEPNLCKKNIEYDAFINDGIIFSRGESTVIELINNKVIVRRHGAIQKKEIDEII